jgi:hypothetical protein
MAFDRAAAKAAGYTDEEINAYTRKPIKETQPAYDPFGAEGNPILEGLLQGATFGFSDEMQAGLKTAYDKATGDDREWGDVYRKNVQAVRQPMEAYQQESPMTSLGLNLAGGIGTGATLAKLGAKAMPGAAKFAGMHPVTSSMAGGAGAGGVAGAGFAPTMEEIPEYAGSGALMGAIAPPLLAGAGKIGGAVVGKPAAALGRKVGGMLDTPKQRAAKMTAKALKRDEMGLGDVAARQQELGPEAILADVGGVNVQRLAQTIASTPGKAADISEKVLQGRMIKSPERLVSRMKGALKGNQSAYRFMKDTIEQRKKAAGPLYKSAFEVDAMVTPGSMDELLSGLKMKVDDFEGTSIGRALKGVERSLTMKKNGQQLPKMQLKKLHAAKQDLDLKIDNSYKDFKPTSLTTELMGIKKELLDVMDLSSDNYKQARKIFSDDSSVLSSTRLGKQILKTDAEEMQDALITMSDAEKKGFITGAMQTISDNLKGTKEGANAARKMATPLIKERLRNAFTNEADFNNFVKGLEAEDVFAEVRNNVLRGSQTQQRLATAGESAAEAGIDLAQGRWLNTALNGIRSFFGGNAQIPEPVRDELAELLFRDVASGKMAISKELTKRLKRHDISERMVNNMLATLKTGVPVAAGETGAILEQ